MNRPFRKKFDTPRLSREEAERQGRVSKLAFETLREPAVVVAFLNGHDDDLGGRPIDLAVASPEGLLSVERVLAGRAGPVVA